MSAKADRILARLDIDSSIDRKARRYQLSCSFCKPHRQENARRKSKHGHKKLNKQRRGK